MNELKRSALVVASAVYQDPKLRQLRAPARDAEELARVLKDPEVGGFEVGVSINEPEHVVRRKLAAFFQDRGLDELLLLHLSCHGLKDDDGHLYFATTDTEVAHLDATSIPSEFVNRQMNRSRSRRIVLLLDCCYSGAFATGMLSRAGDRVDIMERFDGRGRMVLTASSAMEYSFEGDELTGAPNPSVFTSALVRGLETGEADRDRDGWISVDELYDYAYDEVRAVTPSQTPGKWTFDVQGELYLARSSLEPEPAELPAELGSAIESPFAHVRAGAVEELARLLRGTDTRMAETARAALEELREDDSRRVTDAAARALEELPAAAEAVQERPAAAKVVQEPPPPVTTRTLESADLTRRKSTGPVIGGPLGARPVRTVLPLNSVSVLALAGAGALLAALAVPLTQSYYDWNTWVVFSPLEAIAVALAVATVGLTLRQGRIELSLAAGLLVAFGLVSTVASISLAQFAFRNSFDSVGKGTSIFVVLGAIAILAAGWGCIRPEPTAALHPRGLGLGVAGVVLLSLSLYVKYEGSSSLLDELQESSYYVYPPLAVIAVAIVALLLAGTGARPRFIAGMLLALGAQSTMHYLGLLIGAGQRDGATIQAAGFVGLLGALFVVAGGVSAYRSSTLGTQSNS